MRWLGPVLAVPLLPALALLAALAGPVAAGEEWCDTDPLLLIRTPAGAIVPVYVTSGALGVEHQAAVLLVTTQYTAQSVQGGRATLVQVSDTVPSDVFAASFATRFVVSSGPMGTALIYGQATGTSGQPMALSFTLAVP
jgi:hypothetical protein